MNNGNGEFKNVSAQSSDGMQVMHSPNCVPVTRGLPWSPIASTVTLPSSQKTVPTGDPVDLDLAAEDRRLEHRPTHRTLLVPTPPQIPFNQVDLNAERLVITAVLNGPKALAFTGAGERRFGRVRKLTSGHDPAELRSYLHSRSVRPSQRRIRE